MRNVVCSAVKTSILAPHSDVQSQEKSTLEAVDWVGMGEIQTQILLTEQLKIPATLDFQVNLKEGYRGIHMSRLYSLMMSHFLNQNLSFTHIDLILSRAIESQSGLSSKAALSFKFKLPLMTTALKSSQPGFRLYDVQSRALKDLEKNKTHIWISFDITYSSTCPQSASLSLEILNSELQTQPQTFSLERLPATPHAQRSVMNCELYFVDGMNESQGDLNQKLAHFIGLVENALKTPVQTAVKKSDEMAFAQLNSENLMFCEDAVRLVSSELKKEVHLKSNLRGFKIKTRHEESLHPHNAISQIQYQFQNPDFN